MIKKLLQSFLFSVLLFALVGCSDDSSRKGITERTSTISNSKHNESSEHQNSMKLSDFRNVNILSLENPLGYEFKDLKLENADAIIFQPIHLKEGEKVTLASQIQSNDSFNNVNIGVIKDYTPDSATKYEIESIYSKPTDKELTVTFTSQDDANYAICILGTMAATVGLNGKITKD